MSENLSHNEYFSKAIDLLSNYETVTKTLNNAKSSFNLTTGYLDARESKTYDLRLWLHENVATEMLNIQNTVFNSKIIVTTNYVKRYLMLRM